MVRYMIKIQNIYYMLAYAFQVLNEDSYANIAYEEFEHAGDLLAAILSKGLANQLKRGLGREYIAYSEMLSAPYGKIDISASIKRKAMLRKQLVCEFDEFSDNNYLNQIIKTSAMLLIRSTVIANNQKRPLKKLMLYFSGVDEIDTHYVKWSNIRYHRNNATYKMLINICFLIIEALIPTTQHGSRSMMQFKDDHMNRLYEKFVLEYYRKHYPTYKVSASHIDWNVDDGIFDLLPTMKSDITLEHNGKTLIIDTKYYGHTMQMNSLFDSHTIHSGNLYQIFTYVKNRDIAHSGDVSGLLLYAKTDEGITPDNSYLMDGNKISVKTLDLDRNFDGIKEQLDLVALEWLN